MITQPTPLNSGIFSQQCYVTRPDKFLTLIQTPIQLFSHSLHNDLQYAFWTNLQLVTGLCPSPISAQQPYKYVCIACYAIVNLFGTADNH